MRNSKIRSAIYFISPLVMPPVIGIVLLTFFNSPAYGDGQASVKQEQTVKGNKETATATVTVTDNVTKSTSVQISSSAKLDKNGNMVRTETDTAGLNIKTTQGTWTVSVSVTSGWVNTNTAIGDVPITTTQPNRSFILPIPKKW